MTITLLLNARGKEDGKTQRGASGSTRRPSPFEFFQYWRNVATRRHQMPKDADFSAVEEIAAWRGGGAPSSTGPRRSWPGS